MQTLQARVALRGAPLVTRNDPAERAPGPRAGRAPSRAAQLRAARIQASSATAPAEEKKDEKKAPSPIQLFLRDVSLARQPPWAYVQNGSVLVIELSGSLPEVAEGRRSISLSPPPVTLPSVCDALRKAAVDPRITGIFFKVGGLACGWAKLQEFRAHLAEFRQSGKYTVAYLEVGGEKEYYAASACEELYTPPGAYVSLRGLSVSGTFLRGVLEKVGIEPQIKRIGKYKSAGDQLGRKDMSEAQREVLNALLKEIFDNWVQGVAKGRGKTEAEVLALLDDPAGVFDMKKLKAGGWITDTKYLDELNKMLRGRTGGAKDELRVVTLPRYNRTRPQSLGVDAGVPSIAVVRAAGSISRGGGGNGIQNEDFIRQIKRIQKDKRVKAVVLRIDSPGGDALASDLMWREIRLLAREKPVVASMVDVAASGGYYMAMAADKIVAEPLTLTGSIGEHPPRTRLGCVITGKFNLSDLYERIGFNKEIISKGRFAQVDADNRSFTSEEEKYFDNNAQVAYASFRDKAAASRGMPIERMEELAQGRVWTGRQAKEAGLVDELGGLREAVAIARQMAGFKETDPVAAAEYPSAQPVVPWAGAAGGAVRALSALAAAAGALAEARALAASVSSGVPQAMMEDVTVGGFEAGAVAGGRQLLMGAAEELLGLGTLGGGRGEAAAENGDDLFL